jgi:hypothetical protein
MMHVNKFQSMPFISQFIDLWYINSTIQRAILFMPGKNNGNINAADYSCLAAYHQLANPQLEMNWQNFVNKRWWADYENLCLKLTSKDNRALPLTRQHFVFCQFLCILKGMAVHYRTPRLKDGYFPSDVGVCMHDC